jgi:hypothetical protein
MQRTVLASAGVVFLVLLSIVPATHAETAPRGDGGVNATLERPDPLFEKERLLCSPGPEAGIRRYGVWPVERARPRTAGETTSAVAETEPSPEGAAPLGPGVGANYKISNGVGAVDAFAVSRDGTMVVFTEDVGATTNLLFSVPIDGSAAPTQLSSGLGIGSPNDGVTGFAISPDSTRVIFIADTNSTTGTDTDFFTVPIDGSVLPAVKLNVNAPAPVTAYGFTPDGTTAAFFAPDTATAQSVEVHAAPADGTGPDRQLSDVASTLPGLGNVVTADFSPDSQWTTYAADDQVDDLFQWFSVPIAAAGPGLDNQLSNAITGVALHEISDDNTTVAYTGDDITSGILEVFTVPIGGGVPTRLNPPGMLGAGVTDIEISQNSIWVAYLAEGNTAGIVEVYAAALGVQFSGTRLNFPLVAPQTAGNSLNIGPDSFTVLYEADQRLAGTTELFNVPIVGGASTLLHQLTPPADAGFFTGSGTPIIGRRALYPIFGATVDLFSVPFDGSEPFVQLNDPLVGGDALFNGFFSFDATRLMAYGGGPSTGSVTDEINSVTIRRDFAPEQINVTAPGGANGVIAYVIDPQENYGVYIQDQDDPGVTDELFVRELDTDGDTVVNPLDNCPFIVNPAQTPQIFPDTVRVEANKTTFSWTTRLEARYVRGPLAMVSTYAINDSGSVLDAVGYDDGATPGTNDAWYYMFAHDCNGRSYQTVLGDEPGRDLAPIP